jgi:hypothetical protein
MAFSGRQPRKTCHRVHKSQPSRRSARPHESALRLRLAGVGRLVQFLAAFILAGIIRAALVSQTRSRHVPPAVFRRVVSARAGARVSELSRAGDWAKPAGRSEAEARGQEQDKPT